MTARIKPDRIYRSEQSPGARPQGGQRLHLYLQNLAGYARKPAGPLIKFVPCKYGAVAFWETLRVG